MLLPTRLPWLHINFLVALAGPFSARLRPPACRHPSSRLRRCAAPPGPTGRPRPTTLRPAGPRWRRPMFPSAGAPSAHVPACDLPALPPRPELSPLRRSCVEDFAAGACAWTFRPALDSHRGPLASHRWSMRLTARPDPAGPQPATASRPAACRAQPGRPVRASAAAAHAVTMHAASGLVLLGCCAACWAGCEAWRPATSVGLFAS